jgi:hypothetical protein
LAALLALLLAGGCASGQAARPRGADLSGSGEAFDLARSLYEAGRQSPSLAARGGLTLTEGNSPRVVRFELLISGSGRWSLTILDPLGRPALKAVSDGLSIAALYYQARVAAVGLSAPDALDRIIPLGLGQDALLAVLSAAPPLRPDQAAAGRGRGGEMTSLLVSTLGPSGEISWTMSLGQGPGEPRLAGFAVKGQPGLADLQVAYGSFRSVPAEGPGQAPREFPHQVDAVLGDGRRLAIRYDEVRLGAAIPPELFEVAVPDGFQVESI